MSEFLPSILLAIFTARPQAPHFEDNAKQFYEKKRKACPPVSALNSLFQVILVLFLPKSILNKTSGIYLLSYTQKI